jgi:hypothetical protein
LLEDRYVFALRLTLFCLAGDIVLTNGFMLLRVPPVGAGVPINEVLLAFNLIAILLMRHSKFGFTDTPVFPFLALLWVQSSVELLIGLEANGVWAIRDAANLIETGFLFVGFWLASDYRFLPIFDRWFRRVLTFAGLYVLIYPLKDYLVRFSPAIPSMNNYSAPLFFSYDNPNSVVMTAACLMILSNYGSQLYRTLLTAAIVMVLVVFVQARLTYLLLGLLVLTVLLSKPHRLSGFAAGMFVAATLVGLFLASGIELPGRLGTTFTLDFLVNHFAAIWGGGTQEASTAAAAEGVDLRFGWWVDIHNNLQRDLSTWIFGLGYGMPLTSFHGPHDEVVREPHNSFISIYGRLGVFGAINFVLLQVSIIVTAMRLVAVTKRTGSTETHALAITILYFLSAHLLYSATEGGFEKSFIAVPWYFLGGVVVALHKTLVESQKTRPVPAARGLTANVLQRSLK